MKYLILLFVLFTFSTNINQKPVVASYDVDHDLMLVEHNYDLWYVEQMLEKQGFFGQDSYENARSYRSAYWDKTNNTYYYTYDLKKTNGITYDLDTNLQFEPIIDSRFREILTTEDWKHETTLVDKTNRISNGLLYIGNTSFNERAYIDLYNTNIQYIKELHLVSNMYVLPDGSAVIPMDSPVYPTGDPILGLLSTIYTNQQGQKFRRSWDQFTLVDK